MIRAEALTVIYLRFQALHRRAVRARGGGRHRRNVIEAPWLVNGAHRASLRRHKGRGVHSHGFADGACWGLGRWWLNHVWGVVAMPVCIIQVRGGAGRAALRLNDALMMRRARHLLATAPQ
jgi:hypothetical protein